MSRTLSVLLALVLVFGVAFAYDGFDAGAGTGTIGVGQVDHPVDGDAPDELVATMTATTVVEWTCTKPDNSASSEWMATSEQEYISTAPAKLNPKEMVLNYTFDGWVAGEVTVTETNHPYGWYLQCLEDNILELDSEETSYSGVSFSY